MSPRFCLAVGLLLLGAGFATAQYRTSSGSTVEQPPTGPAAPPPMVIVDPSTQPRDDAARAPTTPPPSPASTTATGMLSDMLTVFIIAALIAGAVVAVVLAVGLYFRLRAAEDPLMAALDDAWVQSRLRELEANPHLDEETPPAEVTGSDVAPVEHPAEEARVG